MATAASLAVPTHLSLRLLLLEEVLEEVRVVLELRWIMHVVWVLPLPRLPLLSLMRQLRIMLRLVSLCDRVVLLVPVLRLLHVVRYPWVFVDLERFPLPLLINLGRSLLVARDVVLQKRRLCFRVVAEGQHADQRRCGAGSQPFQGRGHAPCSSFCPGASIE